MHNQKFIETLTLHLFQRPIQGPSSDESWYSVLLDPDMTDSRRVKKAFVRMAELIAALVTIRGLLTFLTDMYSFLDPPGGTVGLSFYHSCLCPVDHVVFLRSVFGESGLVMFWLAVH